MSNAQQIEKMETPIAAYNPFRSQLAQLKADNSAVIFDYESVKGNKEARSHIYKLRQTKSAIDKVRKDQKAVALEYGRKVDSEAKEIVAEIEIMISVHETPIKEIEDREKDRIEDHNARLNKMREFSLATENVDGTALTAKSYRTVIEFLEYVKIDDSWEEFTAQAGKIKDECLEIVRKRLADREKYESEQAELEKLRKEAVEQKKKDHEESLKREAAEKATRDAEAKAERERVHAENAGKAEREAAERRELELKLQAEKSEREKAEAIQRAENAINEAAEQAKREAEQKAKAEAEELAKREANKRHCGKINREAAAGIIDAGFSEDHAKQIVTLIATGKIKHVTIQY